MTPEERKEKLDAYARAAAELDAALERFPREMWSFKPGPDRWSIHEVLLHLADSEANSYIRCRRLVAEPGSAVLAYDEERWTAELHYHDQDPEEAVELFRLLRGTTAKLLRRLPPAIWAHTIEHSESGTMTLDDWLAIYAAHIPAHIDQMQATHVAWLAARRGEAVEPKKSFYPGER
jgi:hypothetical protein